MKEFFLAQQNSRLPIISIWYHRELISELVQRELSQRYRGSFLGAFWSLIIPLVMLLIYTFVFGVVFKARWQGLAQDLPPQQFALVLFAGLAAFNVFSEVVNRAPNLVVGVPNYVKKVIFPLEILPVVSLLVALVNSLIVVCLILVANLIIQHSISITLFLLPLAYLPLILICLAASWFLSSLGVYIRDVGQGIGVVVQVLFFISPVFYPIEAVPAGLRPILALNPLATVIQSFRQVLLWGQPLSWLEWGAWTAAGLLLALLGYTWFMKTKKGFADVL
jgi:lipopolysaccharide transport system permease protein